MTPLELTEGDLEIAEASVKFALENCPVEGVLSNEDGTPVTLDELQSLLEKMADIASQHNPASKLNEEDLARLRVVIDYTSENCPVEGVATFHDGKLISGKGILTLAEKLRGTGRMDVVPK